MNVVSLFDESGNALRPWASAGYTCWAFDTLNDGRAEYIGDGVIHYIEADLTDPDWIENIVSLMPVFVMGFPPCTDMAVSGSSHFEKKMRDNLFFQAEATALARTVETVGNLCKCPWFAENPVSTLATSWRKPDEVFDPCDYGGYLPADDIHPRWPEYITPRDAYPKTTLLWSNKQFKMPLKLPVPIEPGWSTQQKKLGGKSAKTKQIRSETPRGFAQAVFETHA